MDASWILASTTSKSSFFKAIRYLDPITHIVVTIILQAPDTRQKAEVGGNGAK